MYVKDLIYITVIAKEKYLSTAAKKLGVFQPTLSNFLTGLEKQLGTDLFYRNKKKLIPTQSGQIYLNAAQKIIDIHDQIYVSIHRIQSAEKSCIKVAATPARGAVLFASIYPVFSSRYPEIGLSLKESYMSDTLNLITNEQVDFGLVAFQNSEDPVFDYVITSREEMVLAVPAFHNIALHAKENSQPAESLPISEVKDSSFILFARGTNMRSISDYIFLAAGVCPLVLYESFNDLVILNMIRKGFGIGLLPRSVAGKYDDIVCFSLQPRCFFNLGIAMKKGRRLNKYERYFAYLAMENDRKSPFYVEPPDNPVTRSILNEFSCEQKKRGL